MDSIQVLPQHLVNKIAAGECIERPASVVKELVENALDAGATRIQIVLEDGGKKLIRVVDTGGGISPDDLPLAIKAHATSKLTVEEQLYSISSLGFRGEALASIGSISQLKITSALPGAVGGACIEVNGGTVGQVQVAACAGGTTVEVRNLFFDTPARRKFLRSASTELGHIEEQLTRIALHRPGVAFTLKHKGRTLRQLPAVDNRLGRIEDLFGSQLADGLIPILSQESDGTVIEAYVSRPQFAKSSNRWQYFFVNDRWVKDRFMYHAVNQAYRGLAGSDRYCVAFLFVHVDPTKVDVNVHPTKSEVRFVDSGLVHSQILGALREKFLGTDLTVSLPILVQGPGGAEPAGEQKQAGPVGQVNKTDQDDKTDPYSQRLRRAMTDYLSTHKGMGQSGLKFDRSTSLKTSVQDKTARQESGQLPHRHADRMAEQSGTQQMPREQLPREVPALQVHNRYLVLESSEGIMIVDQHALHERVIYQQLTTRLAAGAIEQQKLLIPQVVQVTPGQLACLLQITESLAAIGLELQQFSPQAVAVHSFPAMLERLNAQELIEDLLNRLDESALDDRQALLENILQSMACKAAVKAGDPLTPQEIQALLEQSASVDYSASCPHGRPTSLRMTLAELEKRFHRT